MTKLPLPINIKLRKILVEDIMNGSFSRQTYFGKMIHQFGLDQTEGYEQVLRGEYVGFRRIRFRRRR